jgi:hypothetical protein
MKHGKAEPNWEGTNVDLGAWKTFVKSSIWKAFLFEIEDREKYLIQLFKDSDQEWPPDVIKGKLTELDYIKQIPVLLMVTLEDHKKELRKDEDNG